MTGAWRTGSIRGAPPAGAAVPAPASGVTLGVARGGPVALRLFRAAGTRVVVAGEALPAQLLALRAASAGTPVHVTTPVPERWAPVVAHGPGSGIHRLPDPGPTAAGPALIVDEHPDRSRTDVRPWQCRVEIRSEWTAADLGSFTSADVTVLGRVPSETHLRIAALYGLSPRATEAITGLPPRTVALLRRGRMECVELQLTADEEYVLERAGRQLTASRIAP